MYVIGWLSDELLTSDDRRNKQEGNIRKHCALFYNTGI